MSVAFTTSHGPVPLGLKGRRCKATQAVISLVRLAMGCWGWLGEAAATPNWGTRIAALPRAGQARVGRGRVVVVVGVTVVVVSPGYVVVVDVEVVVDVVVVVVVEVVVVPAMAVVGLVPTMRAIATAPTPSTEIVTRQILVTSE
jgi:hypothetical protein